MTRWLENERLLAALLLAPAILLLGLFIAYPFVIGVWLSLSNTSVGNVGEFVGLKNFVKAWNDSIFRTAFWNTTFYTFWATIFKLSLGMWLALLLNRSFRGKHRAGLHAPALHRADRAQHSPGAGCSTRRSACSATDALPGQLHHDKTARFLSGGTHGMWCTVVINTWRGMPFFTSRSGGTSDHRHRSQSGLARRRCAAGTCSGT
jgi:multiple sugar transport system permease protein